MLTPAAAFGIPVCRLGLASHGQTALTPDDILYALERGVNFLNWPGEAEGPDAADAYSTAIAGLGRLRRAIAVCVQFGARTAAEAATELRSILATLHSDYVDVLTLYYVERPEEWRELTGAGGALGYLRDAQRDGAIRRLGITSHQRRLAADIARSGLIEVLMIRYSAAHRRQRRARDRLHGPALGRAASVDACRSTGFCGAAGPGVVPIRTASAVRGRHPGRAA